MENIRNIKSVEYNDKEDRFYITYTENLCFNSVEKHIASIPNITKFRDKFSRFIMNNEEISYETFRYILNNPVLWKRITDFEKHYDDRAIHIKGKWMSDNYSVFYVKFNLMIPIKFDNNSLPENILEYINQCK